MICLDIKAGLGREDRILLEYLRTEYFSWHLVPRIGLECDILLVVYYYFMDPPNYITDFRDVYCLFD